MAADVLIMIWKPLPWKKAPARVLALMLLNSDPGHHGTNTKGHNTAETTKKSSREVVHRAGDKMIFFFDLSDFAAQKRSKKGSKSRGKGSVAGFTVRKKLMS